MAPRTRSGSVYQLARARRPSTRSPAPRAAPIGCAAATGPAPPSKGQRARPVRSTCGQSEQRAEREQPMGDHPSAQGPAPSSLLAALSPTWESGAFWAWRPGARAPKQSPPPPPPPPPPPRPRGGGRARGPGVGRPGPEAAPRAPERAWRGGSGRSRGNRSGPAPCSPYVTRTPVPVPAEGGRAVGSLGARLNRRSGSTHLSPFAAGPSFGFAGNCTRAPLVAPVGSPEE